VGLANDVPQAVKFNLPCRQIFIEATWYPRLNFGHCFLFNLLWSAIHVERVSYTKHCICLNNKITSFESQTLCHYMLIIDVLLFIKYHYLMIFVELKQNASFTDDNTTFGITCQMHHL